MISNEQRLIDSRALQYYYANKAQIAERRRVDYAAKRDGTYIKRPNRFKSDGELVSLRQGAFVLGISTHKLTNIVNRTTRFNCQETITLEGRVMYKVKDLLDWKSHNLDLFEEGQLVEAGTCKLSPNVMLLIGWMNASKHVVKYCLTQRKANKILWSKYA